MSFIIHKATDVTLSIHLFDKNGVDINLTNTTVYLTIKKNLDDTDEDAIIAEQTTDHITPEEGLTEIDLSNADTNVDPGTYYYDIQIKHSDDTIQTIEFDKCVIKKKVTNRV